ncbi:DUF2249 domain-containing protein [Undibacterium luofuense]|uniref:DUF2249 domain-containing protein n=1 Tax=Undibacterium luofuense TaxID=2828733 RepID=A0A941DKD8_9BURK|nr:DUF2249 domain-containing protein [Undibacterium luofuense]MBR7781649.1 DUF2249 domain-containing protein [Undibacterium luofuense]
MAHDCSLPTMQNGVYAFDARSIAKRFRHAAIFGALNALDKGETMRFCNDHYPLPLLQQITHLFGDRVQISPVSEEPGAIIIDFVIVQ